MFNNRRVEEDLERIRRANLPDERLAALKAEEQRAAHSAGQSELRFSFKDIFAMTIAVFSLVLPYVFIIGGALALALFLFLR